MLNRLILVFLPLVYYVIMDSKELLEHYQECLESAGYTAELSRYLSTLAKQALLSIDTLNLFTECKIVVSLENL